MRSHNRNLRPNFTCAALDRNFSLIFFAELFLANRFRLRTTHIPGYP